jgi:nucleoid DNA-binding protein
LVAKVYSALEQGQIIGLGNLGSFQVSLIGTPSKSREEVTNKKVKSVSLIFRPGPRFKKMLTHRNFITVK